jgi:hypothetical protein
MEGFHVQEMNYVRVLNQHQAFLCELGVTWVSYVIEEAEKLNKARLVNSQHIGFRYHCTLFDSLAKMHKNFKNIIWIVVCNL